MAVPHTPDDTPLRTELLRVLEALVPPARKLVVAVSGGPDSTAMLHVLATLPEERPELLIVHINHQLRSEASDGDAAFVRELCESLGVPCVVRDGPLNEDIVRARGVEAAARSERYRLLGLERDRVGADYIATAHTQSDQAETVLMRLLTGRGTWRLSGILPMTAGRVIRPILGVSSDDVKCYLANVGIEARHDESNDDTRFLRNRIRHELLPMVEEWNPRVKQLLAETASLELERTRAFDDLISSVKGELVHEAQESATLRLDPKVSPHVLRCLALEQVRRLDSAAREVDAESLRAITDSAAPSTRMLSPRLRARQLDSQLVLELIEDQPDPLPFSLSIRAGDTVVIPEAGVAMSLREVIEHRALVSHDGTRQVIQLPPGVPAELEIRSRRTGDRFRPLGMAQDKNLADFLIDRRIPSEERNTLPLLVCRDAIVWVPGVEVSEEFKVRPSPGTRLEVAVERIGGER